MKKIAMFTMGTRGDVQPYIFLSKELIKSGYAVTLGSHPCWRGIIEKAGIRFAPIGPDIDIEKETAIIRGKSFNPAMSMLKTMSFVSRIIRNSCEEVYEICKGMDLIVVSHSQMGAAEAEILGIPTVNVTIQKEMLAEKDKPSNPIEKAVGKFIAVEMVKPCNKIRKKYGLKPVKSFDEIISKDLNLLPVSKYVVKRSPYWSENNILTGYWYYDEPEYIPDEKLAAFLASGEKPVILALGAMSFEDKAEKKKLDMFVSAFTKTGCRAVIQGFNKTLTEYELPDTMISVGSIPYGYLFKKAAFVIHHCGFGTSASTMLYGIPSIPVPHLLDQLGFADELYKINVATKPIMSNKLSERTITEAINEMRRTYDEKKKNALDVSAKLNTENGTALAVSLIEAVIKKYEQ